MNFVWLKGRFFNFYLSEKKGELKELWKLQREVKLTQRNRTLKNAISRRLNPCIFSEISYS